MNLEFEIQVLVKCQKQAQNFKLKVQNAWTNGPKINYQHFHEIKKEKRKRNEFKSKMYICILSAYEPLISVITYTPHSLFLYICRAIIQHIFNLLKKKRTRERKMLYQRVLSQ